MGDVEGRLAHAATDMIVAQGTGFTMNALIAASGISRKTVYARHPNKRALMEWFVHRMLDIGLEPLAVTDGDDWRESLRDFIHRCIVEIHLPQTTALRRILESSPDFLDEVRPRIEQVLASRFLTPLTAFLDRLAADGRVLSPDTGFVAATLINLIVAEAAPPHLGSMGTGPRPIGSADPADYADRLTRLFCDGIAAR